MVEEIQHFLLLFVGIWQFIMQSIQALFEKELREKINLTTARSDTSINQSEDSSGFF